MKAARAWVPDTDYASLIGGASLFGLYVIVDAESGGYTIMGDSTPEQVESFNTAGHIVDSDRQFIQNLGEMEEEMRQLYAESLFIDHISMMLQVPEAALILFTDWTEKVRGTEEESWDNIWAARLISEIGSSPNDVGNSVMTAYASAVYQIARHAAEGHGVYFPDIGTEDLFKDVEEIGEYASAGNLRMQEGFRGLEQKLGDMKNAYNNAEDGGEFH
tara:strand:+ start:10005 stop:10655 length:651 start_codon:yes stop_codon:yes gene_type:complete